MKRKLKRVFALVFCAIFMTQGVLPVAAPVTAYAADDPELANWSIHLDFVDPDNDQNLTDDYQLNVSEYVYNPKQIKLQVTIKYTGDGSTVYEPEEVSFSLEDLRDMIYADFRYSYGYDIAAELKGSGSGRGDWYYVIDDEASSIEVDCNRFLFTNKNRIDGAFTSTFQLIFKPEVDKAPPIFTKTFKTSLSFSNLAGIVQSNEAKFTFKGEKSEFAPIAKYTALEDGAVSGVLGKIPEGKTCDDYIFAKISVSAPYSVHRISNIYKSEFRAAFPDDVLVSDECSVELYKEGIFAGANSGEYVDSSNIFHAYGTYSNNTPLIAKDEYSMSFVAGFPRDKYLSMGTYTQNFDILGKYYGATDFQLITTFSLTFSFSEFQYVWKPGNLYSQQKDGYAFRGSGYEDSYDFNFIDGNMSYGYTYPEAAISDYYSIDSTAIYKGTPFDLVIGDDLQYLLYEDNTYRKLEDDERIVTEVYIKNTEKNNDVEIYGRAPGQDSYELYKSLPALSSSKTVKITKTYSDIYIKYIDVTESIIKLRTNVYFKILDNVERDGGKKPVKVYNFSYMDILYNGTVTDFENDREAVITNINGLAEEIDAHDKALYGHIPCRGVGYKCVLPSKAGIHQSRSTSCNYDDTYEVTDKNVYIICSSVPYFYDYQGGGNTWQDFTDTYTLPAGWDTEVNDFSFYFSLYSYDKREICLKDGQKFSLGGTVKLSDLPEALKSQITVTKDTNAEGYKVLHINYNFKDNPLVNTSESFVFFQPLFKMSMDRDTYQMLNMNGKTVRVQHNRTINQSSNETIFTHTTRNTSSYYSCPTIAYSTYQGISIESSVGGGDFDKTVKTISYGQNYEYKLRFATSSSKVKNLVFYDRLDGAYGSEDHWQGIFQGVNVSALTALGITPTIYYSTNASQSSDLSSSGWVKNTYFTGDLSNVKAVAVSLGDNVINPNSMIFVKIKMKATEDTSISNKAAYNNTSVSYKAYDSSLTVLTDDNALENIKDLASNTTQILLQGNQKIHINYIPNGGTGDTLTDTISAQDEYTIRQNSFEREEYTFIGWDPDKDRSDGTAKYQPGQTMSDALVGFDITTPTSDNYVDLYAIWDKVPEVRSETLTFYEGEQVTKEDLLEKATASDEEDGDLTSKIRIVKLVYSEGKIVDGVKTTEKETVSWASDMPGDYKLDTWFMQLDKEDSPVTHKITYEVTDSAGNTSQSVADIKVLYNEFPKIEGNTKHFISLEDARAGKITKDTFLDELIAAGTLHATDKEDDEWYPDTITSKIELVDFSEEFFTELQGPAYTTLYYTVKDSLGKEAVFTSKVFIIKDGEIKDGDKIVKLRFIDQNNYMKNKDMLSVGLTEEQAAECAKNGGLPLNSPWYNDTSYKDLIIPVLANIESSDKTKAIENHSFTYEDILKIKQESSSE